MNRSILVALSALGLVAACKKGPHLPDEVQYRVTLLGMSALAGSELLLNGKVVGQLVGANASSEVNAGWRGPKAGIDEVVSGKYAARVKGACGPVDVALGETPGRWKGKTNEQLAPDLEDHGTTLAFSFVDVATPKMIAIYVDRGASTAKLQIGQATLEHDAEVGGALAVSNCTGAVPVLVDGTQVGELDLQSKTYLITLEPGICHRFQTIGYGTSESQEPIHHPAGVVTALSGPPISFLAPAADSERVGGGGTVSTELVREACQ